MAYLYGASVQGIQDFIFKTNKLQEIVGASEIVKGISEKFKNYDADKVLLNAAGNIKAIFNSKEKCEKVVLEFSKKIGQEAYGITISQAVVEINSENIQNDINRLEKKLKIQRNKPTMPLDMSINIMELNPSTAKPAIKENIDIATRQKLKANEEFYKQNPEVTEFKDFSYISNNKNKLAIIHIDGNGLGSVVKSLGDKLSSFSLNLDIATNTAYNNARKDYMDIRKVIIGGDDVTVICNADNALEFTKNFLQNFEDETQKITELKGISEKLTACAGIAYCNEKYPFHYAVSLAEALCKEAKNHSKRESSCLMFHNTQSSNFQTWEKFIEDELTIKNNQQSVRCDFGAYYLDKEGEAKIEDFIFTVEAYRCDGSPISRLREWLSELYKSDVNAKNLLDRINTITKQSDNWNCEIMDKNLKYFDKNLSNDTLIIDKDGCEKTPIYDILQILSVTEAR